MRYLHVALQSVAMATSLCSCVAFFVKTRGSFIEKELWDEGNNKLLLWTTIGLETLQVICLVLSILILTVFEVRDSKVRNQLFSLSLVFGDFIFELPIAIICQILE